MDSIHKAYRSGAGSASFYSHLTNPSQEISIELSVDERFGSFIVEDTTWRQIESHLRFLEPRILRAVATQTRLFLRGETPLKSELTKLLKMVERFKGLEKQAGRNEVLFNRQTTTDLNREIGRGFMVVDQGTRGRDQYFIVKGRRATYALVAVYPFDQGIRMIGKERDIREEFKLVLSGG